MTMHATFNATDDDKETEGTTVFGVEFPRGQKVDISHLPPAQQAKLAGNATFAVEGKPKATGPGPSAQDGEVEIPADWETLAFMTQRALARRLDPSLPRTAGKEDVTAAIQAEVAARSS